VVENYAVKGYPWAELRKDQPGPAERACFGECLQPFERGKLPPNFLKVGTKVTRALERAKDEGLLDHFAFLTCLTCDNFEFRSGAMRAGAALRGQLNLQRFGAPKFQSELKNRQKPAWPIHDKARSDRTAFVRMLNRGPVLFFALRRFAAICRSLAIVSKLPIAPKNVTLSRPNRGYSALWQACTA
jgi:hypothetical protein